jgi:hypothetical protein
VSNRLIRYMWPDFARLVAVYGLVSCHRVLHIAERQA